MPARIEYTKALPLRSAMKLPKSKSSYPGDPVTDHDELMDFLRAQQEQINALGAAIEQLIASSFFDESPHSPES